MAVKKKSAAKKVAKKAAIKRVVKKATAKKSAVKKAVVKKATAKKSAVKKAVVKKATAKKSAVKKSAVKKSAVKKAVVKKKVTKKTAKKAAVKRAVKKPTARASAPVVVATTTAIAPVVTKLAPLAPKPVAAPKQATSGRVVFLVVAGIVILAAIVWSKSASKSDDGAAPTPSISQSAEPTESASPEPTESAVAVAVVEAPSKFVALKSADGLKLRWSAPVATEGLTGYNVELRANGAGDWITVATLPADQLTQSVSKSGVAGWTQFRVTSLYSDGQVASSAVFGIPGEFK